MRMWDKKIWTVCKATWEACEALARRPQVISFCSRDAALMWLKRYAKENTFYVLKDRCVKVMNGIVYFLPLGLRPRDLRRTEKDVRLWTKKQLSARGTAKSGR